MFRLLRPDRRTLINSAIEAVLIVFSVLVALAANRWRDQRVSEHRLQITVQHIRIELENNQAILRAVIPYHEEEVRRIGQLLAQPDLTQKIKGRSLYDLRHQLIPHGYWNPPVTPGVLSDAAWRSAVADDTVTLMPVQLLNQLTAYYSFQNIAVERPLENLQQKFLIPQYFDPKATVLMLRMAQGWFSTMADEEKSVLQEAGTTLKALPPSSKAGTPAKSTSRHE